MEKRCDSSITDLQGKISSGSCCSSHLRHLQEIGVGKHDIDFGDTDETWGLSIRTWIVLAVIGFVFLFVCLCGCYCVVRCRCCRRSSRVTKHEAKESSTDVGSTISMGRSSTKGTTTSATRPTTTKNTKGGSGLSPSVTTGSQSTSQNTNEYEADEKTPAWTFPWTKEHVITDHQLSSMEENHTMVDVELDNDDNMANELASRNNTKKKSFFRWNRSNPFNNGKKMSLDY
jgi:hypothetical protein